MALLTAHVAFPLLWLVVLVQHGPQQNDWWHFRVAAEQFVSGSWDDLYSQDFDSLHPGYFWRYPPFVLYVVAPLAWLPPTVAYVVLAAGGLAALGAAMAALARLTPVPQPSLWAAAILLSAPALTTLITGQLSGWLLLIVVAGAVLWSRGRVLAACAVLGLLAAKPNLGVFFGLFAIVRGEWRGALVMLGVALLLAVTTVPLGPDLWVDFVRASFANTGVISRYDEYKLITLQGFLLGVFGPTTLSSAVWTIAVVLLGAVAVWGWRGQATPATQLASVVLLAVAANPYMSFYDSLLLALPATIWWSSRASWHETSWRLVGALIGAAWLWEHFAHSWSPAFALAGRSVVAPFSLIGPVAAIWLVVAVRQARRRPASVEAEAPCTEPPRSGTVGAD